MRFGFVAAILAVTSALSSPAQAQRSPLETVWWIEPAAPPPGIRQLASKEHVLKQRLLPSGLVRLSRAVSTAEAGIDLAAGSELIEVTGGPGVIFCDGRMKATKMLGVAFQGCLIDQNGDGRFDAAFRTLSQAPALVMIGGRMPGKLLPLSAPISYEREDPATSTLGNFVAIERRNYSTSTGARIS
ncbi:hypothetical protein HMF7854_11960 [Sphingomonas ginkgonis]|uniref:Uncharacterized protein n=1 Tax=Sphingomonas ginkgonis TaxID=2315330 RepID=A0A3R9YMZ1_9SPHN|nr:hypothetical protein [Sphingomonas ginkgonis]RST31474.1 hypothetical protein HMF7854_11960 [Sphingomonas ginkgonis]